MNTDRSREQFSAGEVNFYRAHAEKELYDVIKGTVEDSGIDCLTEGRKYCYLKGKPEGRIKWEN